MARAQPGTDEGIRFGRIARGISWYWGALMDDTHYQHYLEYRPRTNPGEPVLSERDCWRQRHRVESGARCG